jgi:hypothetical protein
LSRSLSDLLVSLQLQSKNQKKAQVFVAQLSYNMWDHNSALQDPVKICGKRFHPPLAQTSNLMAQYNLSINFPGEPLTGRIFLNIHAPIDSKSVQSLCQSLLCDQREVQLAQTTLHDNTIATRFNARSLPHLLVEFLR